MRPTTSIMTTPHSTLYTYSKATLEAANKLPLNSVAERDHKTGMKQGEALILGLDGLYKYASAYSKQYERALSDDYALGASWLKAVVGYRELLNGGGQLWMNGRTHDTFDAGACETVFWKAIEMAGFTEQDVENA